MNSDELNQAIAELDDKDDLPYEAFGGKPIPYIGWFWRSVDFDREDGYTLGILPEHQGVLPSDSNDQHRVGFMENNKWSYDYVHIDAEAWTKLKSLIVAAIEEQTKENFQAVDEAMQSHLPEGYEYHPDPDIYPDWMQRFR